MTRDTHKNNSMTRWLISATAQEIRDLAHRVGTSIAYLRQISYEVRVPSASTAGAIETVAAEMHKETNGRLPELRRADLCPACSGCPYSKFKDPYAPCGEV